MDASTDRLAPIDAELRSALDDLRDSLQQTLTIITNLERHLQRVATTDSLLSRIEALARAWERPERDEVTR